jgi:hypothetical protein
MYLQEVLFKPSWVLASERDVCLMDAPFFYLQEQILLYLERLIQN